jgi:FkbM family methyltransferase
VYATDVFASRRPEGVVSKMKDVSWRRRAANRVAFSQLGIRVLPKVAPFLRRGYNIILNNNFLEPTANGEYWLIDAFPSDGVFVDVGYHQGDWSLEVLSRKPRAFVLAFDPWPDAAQFHASSRAKDKVRFVPLALASEATTTTFYDYASGCNSLTRRDVEFGSAPAPTAREYPVEVARLDEWCLQNGVGHIDLLKVDTEGHDLHVLEGASSLFRSESIDACVFEYGSGWISSRRYLADAHAFLSSVDYRLFKLFNGFLAPFHYDVAHETFAAAMYVALSPAMQRAQRLQMREIQPLA